MKDLTKYQKMANNWNYGPSEIHSLLKACFNSLCIKIFFRFTEIIFFLLNHLYYLKAQEVVLT